MCELDSIINNPGDINQAIGNLLEQITRHSDVYELIKTDLNDILHELIQNSEQNKDEIVKSSNDQTPYSLSTESLNSRFPILNEILNS